MTDTIQIKASAVQPGDVLISGATVTKVRGPFPWITIIDDEGGVVHTPQDALVAVREVVTD